MPAYVTETVIWTCVGAFIICMIAGVLIITGRWEPKDPAIRKWLLRSVFFTAVGSVATFAAVQFSGGGADPVPSPEVNETKPLDPQGQRATPDTREQGRQDRGRLPVGPPRDQEVRPVEDIPQEVTSWAGSELGPRPMFCSAPDYPECVATLRGQDSVSRKEARRCRSALEQLHLAAVVGFYNLKRPYDIRLEQLEGALRDGGISQEELPRYNYVLAEMDRLNGDKSEEVSAVHELEERLLQDIQACRRSLCQPAD